MGRFGACYRLCYGLCYGFCPQKSLVNQTMLHMLRVLQGGYVRTPVYTRAGVRVCMRVRIHARDP